MAAPSLLPREHGAYAQLGVALLSALALAPTPRGLAQAALTAALFLASEPLLILLGRRGAQARATSGRAARRLVLLGILAALGLMLAWRGAPPALAATLLPPACLGLTLFGLFLAGRERSAAGEGLAAWAFAASTLAVVRLGGGRPDQAWGLALILGGLFSQGTVLVHGHLRALRKDASRHPRLASALLGATLVPLAGLLARRSDLPPWIGLSFLPMGLAALGIWLRPPSPRHLKAVGWVAAACALAGSGLAILGLRGS